MIFFTTKSNLNFMYEFRSTVFGYWSAESDLHNNSQNEQKIQLDYMTHREKVSKSVIRASRISGLTSIRQIPLTGQVFSIYDDILSRHRGLHDFRDKQSVIDTINEVIGKLEYQAEEEFKKLINPFYWLQQIIVNVIGFPFLLLRLAGFESAEWEKSLLGKVLKVVIFFALIALLLWYFGFSKEELKTLIQEWLKQQKLF